MAMHIEIWWTLNRILVRKCECTNSTCASHDLFHVHQGPASHQSCEFETPSRQMTNLRPARRPSTNPTPKTHTHTHIAWVRKCCTMWVGSCQSYPTNSQCCKCYKTKWAPGSAGYIYLLIFGPHNVAILLKIHEHMCIRSARRLG